MPEAARDLLAFIDASPTPYHAVAEASRRLRAAGYAECAEQELWSLAPGDRRFVVRHGGSLVAFAIGSESPVDGGFRIVGAHTDSPNLRLKPCADTCARPPRTRATVFFSSAPAARTIPLPAGSRAASSASIRSTGSGA